MFNLAKIKPKVLCFLPSWRFWLKSWWGKPALVLVIVIGLAGFLLAPLAHAGVLSGIGKYVVEALAWVLTLVAQLLADLIFFVIDFIITLSGYNNFLNAPVVSIGWSLTRDVANMFYILVMLIIAFGTMFNLEQYSWKKLLPRLILTAVLVNFSKTIIGLFIDFAQVIMLTFVNGYAAAAGGNFATMFNLNSMFGIAKTGVSFGTDIEFDAALGFILGAIMLGVALIVLAVFAAILLIRIITLWILIVLAPLAFMLGTFPKGQEYYADWWKRLQNQIIVGPVIAFFLWLSLASLGGGNAGWQAVTENNQIFETTKRQEAESGIKMPNVGITQAGSYEILGNFAVSIAMLFLALQMTQQLGVAGAGLASGAAGWMKQQGVKWAKRAAVPAALGLGIPVLPALGLGAMYGAYKGAGYGIKKGAKYVGAGVWSKVKQKVYESPVGRIPIWFKEGSRRREEELKRAEAEAMASKRMRYEKGRFGYTADYVRLEKQKRASSAAKDFEKQYEDGSFAASTSGTAWAKKFSAKDGNLGHEGNDRHRALSQLIFEAAYIDDMMDIDSPEMEKIRGALLWDVEVNNDDGTVNKEETKKARMTKSTENYRKLMTRGVVGNTSEVDDILWLSAEELAAKSPEDQAGIQKRLGDWSAKHQDELGLLADMKDTAKKTGHYENMGLASFDSRNNQYNVSTVQDQADIINGNLVKMGLVEKAKINPHSLIQMLGHQENNPAGMTELGRLIYSQWLQGMDETNLSRNLLGRTANEMLGLGPQKEPLKQVDEDGGWVELNDDYVNSKDGAAALKEFLSNPLMLKGLYSKIANIAPNKISQQMDKFKFVVGNKEVTLDEIADSKGDIKGALAKAKDMSSETKTGLEYGRAERAVETGEAAPGKMKDAEFKEKYRMTRSEAMAIHQQGPPERKLPPINAKEAADGVSEEIGKLTSQRPEDLGEGLRPVIEEFRAAVEGIGADKLKQSLGSLVSALKGFKTGDEVKTILEGQAGAKDASGQYTPEARFASLLLNLVRQDNKRIINNLTRISRGVEIKGKSKKKGEEDKE